MALNNILSHLTWDCLQTEFSANLLIWKEFQGVNWKSDQYSQEK